MEADSTRGVHLAPVMARVRTPVHTPALWRQVAEVGELRAKVWTTIIKLAEASSSGGVSDASRIEVGVSGGIGLSQG